MSPFSNLLSRIKLFTKNHNQPADFLPYVEIALQLRDILRVIETLKNSRTTSRHHEITLEGLANRVSSLSSKVDPDGKLVAANRQEADKHDIAA